MIRVWPDTAVRRRKFSADLGNSVLAGLGAGLVAAGVRWGLVALALALLGVAARAYFMRRASPTRILLGTQLVQRATLGSATGIALAQLTTRPGQEWPAAIGTVLLVGALMYEVYLRPGAQLEVQVVAHLPGVESTPAPRDVTRLVLIGDLAVAGVGLALAAVGASAWWWVPVAMLAPVCRLVMIRDNKMRAVRANRLGRQLFKAVAAYEPEFAIYTSWPFDASHQVTMWLPYLQRAAGRCVIITRNAVPAVALAKLVDVPVIEARGIHDLDGLVPASMKAAFYPNASSGNGLFVRYPQLTHVFLGHGDSDKPTSYNPTHAMYDRIFSAGEAAVRRYAEHGVLISPEKFTIVGRPQVENILPPSRLPSAVADPVVLYAPTWRGHVEETRLYSLPAGERIVSALLATGASVIFRPHPFSYDHPDDVATIRRIQQLLAADQARTGRQHRWGAAAEKDWGIVDCANHSDAMVSDVSSVVSDYLFSGKPIALVAASTDPENFLASYPIARGCYVIDAASSSLESTLASMLSADPLRDERLRLRTDYLGPFPTEGYASAFVNAVRSVLDAPRQQRESEEVADARARPAAGAPERSSRPAPKAERSVGDDESDGEDDEPDTGSQPSPPPRPARVSAKAKARLTSRLAGYRRRQIRNRRFHQAGSGLAVLALATVIIGVPAVVPALLGLASVIAVGLSVKRTLTRSTRWSRLLHESVATRSVLACAAVLLAVDHDHAVLAAGTVILLIAVPVGEAHIRQWWGRTGGEVRNFPAIHSEPSEPIQRGVIPVLSLAACGFVVPMAGLGVPMIGLLIPAVAVALPYTIVLVRALQRLDRMFSAKRRLTQEVAKLAPKFVAYFGASDGADYQLGMWLPYFARIDRSFIVVTRAPAVMRDVANTMNRVGVIRPIIYRPTLASLEEIITPSMGAVFYVNNAVRNTHFIERRELTHVWLNHGDSEKPACYSPVHAIYDLIFAAGQAGIDRYARHGVSIPAEKFRIVGRPQVELIRPRAVGAAAGMTSDIAPTVLYAPTWQGPYADTRFFSLPMGLPIVDRLLDAGARVIFRAHPLNYQYPQCRAMIRRINARLEADRAATGRQHLWGPAAEQRSIDRGLLQRLRRDDRRRVRRGLGLPAVRQAVCHRLGGTDPEQLLRDAPAARAAYVLHEDLSNLDEVVTNLLGPDPLAELRRSIKTYYLGDLPADQYAEGFLEAARGVIDGVIPVPQAAAGRGDH